MAHDRIIGLYERTAGAWDEVRRGEPTHKERPHLETFAAGLPHGATVLDIGCGAGVPVARDLIAAGFAVTGIDSSPALISRCRERFADADWQVADMRALDLGRRFDGLLAWHSFFHLRADDQRAMFPIFAAHAAPGALLMFTSGPSAGIAMGEWQGEPLFHDSLAQEEYRALLAGNGFDVLSFIAGEPIAQGPSVWLSRYER
jgi:SAM-dependent methyltransferase